MRRAVEWPPTIGMETPIAAPFLMQFHTPCEDATPLRPSKNDSPQVTPHVPRPKAVMQGGRQSIPPNAISPQHWLLVDNFLGAMSFAAPRSPAHAPLPATLVAFLASDA